MESGWISRTLTGKKAFLLAFSMLLFASCTSPANLGPASGSATAGISQTASAKPPSKTEIPSGTFVPPGNDEDPSEGGTGRIYPPLPEGIERIEATRHPSVTGEVPVSLLEQVSKDLSSRLGIETQAIEVVDAEAVIWPDGSLGCPKPGETYTQEPMSGYWIVLQVEPVQYDYHATERGYFFLCDRSLPHGLPARPDK